MDHLSKTNIKPINKLVWEIQAAIRHEYKEYTTKNFYPKQFSFNEYSQEDVLFALKKLCEDGYVDLICSIYDQQNKIWEGSPFNLNAQLCRETCKIYIKCIISKDWEEELLKEFETW